MGSKPHKIRKLTAAQRRLVEQNLGLAGAVVFRRFAVHHDHPTLSGEDLVQEAVIGLCRAAGKFDQKRGTFSTVGTLWSRQAVSRYIENHARTIRLPSHQIQLLRNAEREAEARDEPCGHPDLAAFRPHVVSIHGAADGTTAPQIEAETLDPVELASKREALALILRTIDRLPERQQQVLRLRFGLYSGEARSRRQTAYILGMSRSTVALTERRALERLRGLAREAG